jgi:hypothetical protein
VTFALARFVSLEMVGKNRRWYVCGGWNGGRRKRNGGGMDTWAAHLSCSWRLELLQEVLFMTEEEGES